MEGLNKVFLLGNLGADPELRVTGSGQPVLKLRLATTSSYVDKANTRQERTEWHSITIWGKRGEGLAKILTKGDRILVEGELRTDSYEKDGEKRYRTEVVANNVVLNGRRGDAESRSEAPKEHSRHERRAQESVPRSPQPTNDVPFGDEEIPF